MKRLVIATLVLGISLLGLQAQAQANLLSDPGFDFNGTYEFVPNPYLLWQGREDRGAVTDAEKQSPPYSAELRLLLETGGDLTWVCQTILTGNISPGTTYVASASFLRRADIDLAGAFFEINWRNEGGMGISSDYSPVMFDNNDPADEWVTESYNQFTAPANAAGAIYMVRYEKGGIADPGNIWIDDTYFDAIPEPATMLLFGSGLVGLFGFSRRKRS